MRAASESKSNIFLGAGKYEESVTVSRKIAIEGGWDVVADWQPICTELASKATIIQAPSTSNFTVKITDGDVKLRYLTVRSKDRPRHRSRCWA